MAGDNSSTGQDGVGRLDRGPPRIIRGLSSLLVFGGEAWPVYTALVALGVATALLESIGLGVISVPLIKLVADQGALPEGGLIGQALQLIRSLTGNDNRVIFAALIVLVMLRAVVIYAYSYLSESMRTRTYQRFREAILENYLTAAYAHALRTRDGVVSNMIQLETWQAADAAWTACRAIVSLCIAAVFVIVLVAVSWRLALITGFSGLIFFLYVTEMQGRLRALGEIAQTHKETLSSLLVAALSGLRTLKAYDAERALIGRYRDASSALSRIFIRIAVLSSALRPISDLLAVLLVGGVAFGATVIGASFAETFAFIVILVRMQPLVHSLEHQITTLARLRVSYDAVEGMVHDLSSNRDADVEDAAPISDIGSEIVIEGVSFAYETGARPALRDVTLRIPRGETVAIMGASGAGKTTIISLLLRLLAPDQGEVWVGEGAPLASVRRRDWLALVGVAGQDMELIEGSLFEAIATAAPGVSREAALEALELAGAGEIVDAQPEGLDAQIGARGGHLSGGQRQRILLAAALAKHPQLLLLDEATNAIDANMEAEVLHNIREARPDLTIVVIAHRGAALMTAGHAVVLHEGVVTDAGPPKVLLAKIDGPLRVLRGAVERERTARS